MGDVWGPHPARSGSTDPAPRLGHAYLYPAFSAASTNPLTQQSTSWQ